MSESEIEAAAERDLLAAISDCEGYCRGVYRDISRATVEKVAKALRDRLAADRAEREERDERDERSRPIDAEWLESIGFANTGPWMSIRVGPVELTWERVCGLWVDVARPLSAVKTRGQLLDLLRVLKGGA